MTVFYRLDSQSISSGVKLEPFAAAATNREDHRLRLRVYIDTATGRYKYKFDEDEIIFRHPEDNVSFELVNEIPNSIAKIIKHVSNDSKDPGDPDAKVVLLKPGGTGSPTPFPVPGDAYPAQSVRMMMRPGKFGTHEMVHIGIIVLIQPTDGRSEKIILCDPQVGNGPP